MIRWIEQSPEPARLWVRWRPRGWPRPAEPWSDVAAGELGEPAADREEAPVSPALPPPPAMVDDAVWLPPVAPAASNARRELAAGLAAAGIPVLLQVVSGMESGADPERDLPGRDLPGRDRPGTRGVSSAPGSPPRLLGDDPVALAALARAGVTLVLDPLPVLLAAGADAAGAATAALARAVPGGAVVWPLIPGFGTGEETGRRVAGALAAAGVSTLQPVVLRLTAAQRRGLAEGRGPEVFDALFHRPPPDERTFARAVLDAGMSPFLARPLPRPPLGGAATRRLAGLLALAGELWVRCDRAPAAGQALFRAARWADGAGYDLGALAREGNLGVVAALDERSRALIAEGTFGTPALVRELLAEYSAPAGAGAVEGTEAAVTVVPEEVRNG